MDTEKRKEQRQFYDTKVRVGNSYGKSRNVSMGGMSCTLDNEVKTMEILDIIIYIDEEDAIKLRGMALRCTPITKDFYDVGIYFYTPGMDNVLRKKLANFIGVIAPNISNDDK